MPEQGLHIEAVYQDPDLIEVVVTAANGAFAGVTCFYTNEADLRVAASVLRGFPADPMDRREIRIGEAVWDDRTDAVGAIFFCRDGLGHVGAEVKVTSDDRNAGQRQSVALLITTEAAAIDSFVNELEILAETRRGIAFLRGAG